LTSYGENILTFINPMTYRIHADFFQIGAPTGRLSCHDPNLQQVPNSPEYRSCFTAPPGRKLIIADYSQIELRILAEFSQDPSLLQAFRAGIDLHRMTASQMLGIPFDDITKEQRDAAKALNFGLIYGMGAQGLSNRINTSIEESERLIQKYFTTYGGVHSWLTNAGETAVRDRQCRTSSGRLWSFNFDSTDRSAVASYVRAGKNFPIQGTNADITKRALVLMHAPLRTLGARVVNCIHDEIVVEAAEETAETAAVTVESLMIQAAAETLKTVPVTVNTVIADCWTK
jgi:DNA polymerase I